MGFALTLAPGTTRQASNLGMYLSMKKACEDGAERRIEPNGESVESRNTLCLIYAQLLRGWSNSRFSRCTATNVPHGAWIRSIWVPIRPRRIDTIQDLEEAPSRSCLLPRVSRRSGWRECPDLSAVLA